MAWIKNNWLMLVVVGLLVYVAMKPEPDNTEQFIQMKHELDSAFNQVMMIQELHSISIQDSLRTIRSSDSLLLKKLEDQSKRERRYYENMRKNLDGIRDRIGDMPEF